MTSASPSFRPPWAIVMWADGAFIYSEIPCVSGPPLIQRYSNTEGGLTKALSFLKDRQRTSGPSKGRVYPAPKVTRAKARPLPSGANEEDRAKARAILKKRGLI